VADGRWPRRLPFRPSAFPLARFFPARFPLASPRRRPVQERQHAMADQQPYQPNPRRTAPGSGLLSRRLMWPAGAFLLGTLLVYNSIDPPADPKAQESRPAAAAPIRTGRASVPPLARSVPQRLTIPEIAVDAP